MAGLTRPQMESIIDGGGSVMLASGVLATRKEHLPTEVELAGDDAQKIAQARENLLKQQEAIARQIASLPAPTAPPEPEASRENPPAESPPAAPESPAPSGETTPTEAGDLSRENPDASPAPADPTPAEGTDLSRENPPARGRFGKR
jgi:hypothetical protein